MDVLLNDLPEDISIPRKGWCEWHLTDEVPRLSGAFCSGDVPEEVDAGDLAECVGNMHKHIDTEIRQMECIWNDIVLIVSDFDGVMTDNRVMIDETGKESVYVSRADGQGINILRAMGIELVILSTETNNVVKKRAEKLRVECIHGVKDKAEHLTAYCYKRNIELKNVAYIGNDVNDYNAMQLAGMKIVPCDAYEEVKHIADYVTTVKGGYGVVREVAGQIKSAREKSKNHSL